MKKAIIIGLVCANLALLAWVVGTSLPSLQAQTMRGAKGYLLLTGRITTDNDAVYVIDLTSRRLLGWKFDMTTKKLVPYRGRDLNTDFRSK